MLPAALIFTKKKYLSCMKKWTFLLLLVGALSCQTQRELIQIRNAVKRQLKDYPESTLQDLYKSFFQDAWGAGHMLRDSASAGAYLRRELAESDGQELAESDEQELAESDRQELAESGGQELPYEPCGAQGRYFRVNLSVLKNGTIPYDVFFNAFLKSAQALQPPTLASWIDEWHHIESVINRMQLGLPNYDRDKSMIDSLLQQGDYALHHSDRFTAAYHPHYRIIRRDFFESEIKEYLP